MAEKDLTFAKAFKTVQPKELANKEEFHEVRIPPVNQCGNVDQYPCPMKNSCARHYLVVRCSEKFVYHIPISKLS